jgi:two-component system NtrC family sensor kinase
MAAQPDKDKPEYQIGRAETEKLRQIEQAYLSRPKVSIRLRIVAGFLLCFFFLAVAGLINLILLYRAMSRLHFLDVSQTLSLKIQEASHLARQDFPSEENMQAAMASATSAFDLFLEESASVTDALGEKDVARLNYEMGHYVQLLDDGVTLARAGNTAPAAQKTLADEIDGTGSQILNELRAMKSREAAAAARVLGFSQKLPFLFAAAMLFIIFWITGLLARTITASLRRLEESTRRIASGDFSLINPKRRYHDEFSDLSLAVNRMLMELSAREAQVVKADRLAGVGLLASGFAREVNTTLDSVRREVGSLLEGCPAVSECEACPVADECERRVRIEAVWADALRAKETVASLLEFTLNDGFAMAPVNLHDVVESARHFLQDEMERSGILFSDAIPSDMPCVSGASNQLTHVFVNLFHNAVQAMPHGGSLSVKASLADSAHASVTVSDSGVGIPAEDLPYVFDPFFTTKEDSGTGLGLSISHILIKRHGGEIRVESIVGGGTTIRITLPLSK